MSETTDTRAVNRPGQVPFASLIGTTIEFFDFYIYATAAVLVFPDAVLPGVRSGVGARSPRWRRSRSRSSRGRSAPRSSVTSATASAARPRSSPRC